MAYHVNPTTGEAGACNAVKGKCPFGDASEHFASEGEARAAYEASQGGSFSSDSTLNKLDSLLKGSLSERYKNKEEIKKLWLEATSYPLTDDGVLYIGNESKFRGETVASHMTSIILFDDGYTVSTTKLGAAGGLSGGRDLKKDSAQGLTLDEAVAKLKAVTSKYGYAENAQKECLSLSF